MIQIIKGRRCHIFRCSGTSCKYACQRFLDTTDANSTGNLQKHIKSCWGDEALAAADDAASMDDACERVVKSLNVSGLITASFERKGKGAVTYSTRQHTKAETRTELVCWVAESLRPFKIVKDRGFQSLMKTGRLHYYLPSPSTISRNVKTVFAQTRKRIAKLLQVCCYWARMVFLMNWTLTAGTRGQTELCNRLLDIPESSCIHGDYRPPRDSRRATLHPFGYC